MAQVKITVRPNGPFRVEAPEGSVELVDVNGTPTISPASPHFRSAAAADRSTSPSATEPTAASDSRARSWQ